jgi:Rrf2 family iron-sulfur cluster assembly transcriptional regulator
MLHRSCSSREDFGIAEVCGGAADLPRRFRTISTEHDMHVSTKGRVALAAMLDLAHRQSSGPVPLAAISRRTGVSLSYLEQLFSRLLRHELVASTRGPGGGYLPGRPLRDITVADVVVAVDGAYRSAVTEETAGESSAHPGTLELWSDLYRSMIDYLDAVTLQDLVDQQREISPETATEAVVRPEGEPARLWATAG